MVPKNKVTAAMLAFFTGFMGGHKLYLGHTGGFIGLMILLIVSINVGIPISLFVGVMQGIRLLNMSEQDFDKRYNRGYVQIKRGPLEARRDAQMEKYEQIPVNKQRRSSGGSNPVNVLRANPYKNSGIKKYKDFDLEDAIVDFRKGLEIAPNDVALHFNIACAYSLTEKKSLAYHHLSRAVSLGLKDLDRILSHDDLAFVRIQPEFEKFKSSGFRVNPFTSFQDSEATSSQQEAEKVLSEQSPDMDDKLLAQLNKLSQLRKKGILSEDEFIFERKKIIRI
ncbi:MAG: NINE protein [Saprospiraceae bacterium]|nr:NINE protein [Saprospiraceae bacterium]